MLALVPPSGWFAEELRPGQDCDGDGDVNIACMRSLESPGSEKCGVQDLPFPPACCRYLSNPLLVLFFLLLQNFQNNPFSAPIEST